MSSSLIQAKSIDQFLNDLNSQENVTHVTVGPIVMKISSLFTETMGVNSIKVLCLEDCSSETLNRYKEDIRNLKDPEFEPLVTSNEEREKSSRRISHGL